MAIVGFFDVHREQITFDYVDTATGEVQVGRIRPACRAELRRFLDRFASRTDVGFGVEGCTGWLFVVEELQAAGVGAHVADPAELAGARSRKRRAKTDRADARLGREALAAGRLPESWIPPQHMVHTRALGRLHLDLLVDRTRWYQRVHATLFHLGAPSVGADLGTATTRARAEAAAHRLPAVYHTQVRTALDLADQITARLEPVDRELRRIGRDQPACRLLQQRVFGIGELTAPIIWAELGDCRRFGSSSQAVRHTGLDITVHSSDGKRTAGHLARQGPGPLRWALYEAAKSSARSQAPLHDYYQAVRARRDAGRATLAVARKLARICHHILIDAGDTALAPPSPTPQPALPHRRHAA